MAAAERPQERRSLLPVDRRSTVPASAGSHLGRWRKTARAASAQADGDEGSGHACGGSRSSLAVFNSATSASISAACSVCQASTSGFAELRDLGKQVNAPEQDVDMLGLKDELPFCAVDEAVFHRVGDPNDGIETDDPRGSLERMGRAHERLDHLGRGRSSLERHQARRKRGGVALGLHAEELHHREAAEIAAHGPRLRSAVKTRCSSSRPTLRSFQDKTAWLNPTAGLTRVEGTLRHWLRGTSPNSQDLIRREGPGLGPVAVAQHDQPR